VALDLLAMEPVAGAEVLQGDFTDDAMPERLTQLLGGPPDVVLSDMAPNTTGHAATDHLRIMALAELAADFALRTLAPGGAFVCKLFQGGAERELLAALRAGFAQVRHAKPPASRKDSAESYVVATGRRPAAI
jgi:23S rRNA (uridine2552-2'-O)-methyltransferase